jgi:CheY-like chemotaxis protein
VQMALHGCSILVVEDDPLIGLSIAEMIRRERGTPVGPAANSKEALSAMEGRKLHGAVLDIALKGETVFKLADAIRDRHIPIVFLRDISSLRFRAVSGTCRFWRNHAHQVKSSRF